MLFQSPILSICLFSHMSKIFVEAYDVLYTYLMGDSRKNELYIAKHVQFFQTQFDHQVSFFHRRSCNLYFGQDQFSRYFWWNILHCIENLSCMFQVYLILSSVVYCYELKNHVLCIDFHWRHNFMKNFTLQCLKFLTQLSRTSW